MKRIGKTFLLFVVICFAFPYANATENEDLQCLTLGIVKGLVEVQQKEDARFLQRGSSSKEQNEKKQKDIEFLDKSHHDDETIAWVLKEYGVKPVEQSAKAQIEHPNGKTVSVTIGKKLGGGGTKSFYLCNDGSAVAILNFRKSLDHWVETIESELAGTRYLQAIGIPTPPIEPILLTIETKNGPVKIPSYISPSFQTYREKGAFVLDFKGSGKSNLPVEIFPKGESFNDPSKWSEIVKPLLSDVKKMQQYGFMAYGDSANLIVVRKGHPWHSGADAPFEVRAFPFDFSDPGTKYELPSVSLTNDKAKKMFTYYLRFVLAEGDKSRGTGDTMSFMEMEPLAEKFADVFWK